MTYDPRETWCTPNAELGCGDKPRCRNCPLDVVPPNPLASVDSANRDMMHRAAVDAGYAPLSDYVAPHPLQAITDAPSIVPAPVALPQREISPGVVDLVLRHAAPEALPADDLVNPKTLLGAKRVDLSLLPPAGIIHGAHAMMDGAVKYGPYNWREKKVPARTYIAAAQRHLADFLDGEELASDSSVHHLGHVIGCCAILLDALETGNLIDDRPAKGAAAAILARLEAAIKTRADQPGSA